jgi:hypothetical protein
MRQRRVHLRSAVGYVPSDPELAWLYGNADPPPRSRAWLGAFDTPGADPGLDPVQAAEVRADARRGGVASPMRSVAFRGSGEHHTVLMHSLPAAGSARHATVTRHRTSARAIVQDQSACLQASRPSRPLIYVVDDGSNRTQGACA